MASTVKSILSSPALAPTSTFLAFSTVAILTKHVNSNGPIPIFHKITKYNSILYSLFSLILCLCIAYSYLASLPKHQSTTQYAHPTTSLIYSSPIGSFDETLRFVYHASKFYEYIDLFNVIGAGGNPNTHFLFHHATTPYLTQARVITHSTGWHIFAILNTFHHFLMYAYFGGASVFSKLLPWTGYLQLIAGIGVDAFIVGDILTGGRGCGDRSALRAHLFGGSLLVAYAVLFWGDVKGRGEMKGKEEAKEKKIEG